MSRPLSESLASRARQVFIVVAIATFVVGMPPAGADDPSARLDSLRARVDDVADRYFDAQADLDLLDDELAMLERQIADAQTRTAHLREVATQRAIEVYKANDASIENVLADDALDSARRVELIDRANAGTEEAFRALDAASSDLEQRRKELEARRHEQTEVLERLTAEQAALEALLADARAAFAASTSTTATSNSSDPTTATAGTNAPATTGRESPTTGAPETPGDPAPVAAPPGPGGVHLHHDDPFLVCTRQRESHGDYGAVSPAGYYGAYQFSLTTWDATAAHAARGELIGVVPSTASAWDQDDLAWALYQWQGKRPWGNRC
jgi:hypothetical protein